MKIPLGWSRGEANPWILTAVANPRDAIAYLNGREEKEIIIDPKAVNILKNEAAPEFLNDGGNIRKKVADSVGDAC